MKVFSVFFIATLVFFKLAFSQETSLEADPMTVAGNGMLLQKYRLKIIAENIANISTHMTDRGEPYKKKYVVVAHDTKSGVRARGIAESNAPFGKVYDPSHIYTNQDGYLKLPNFELNDEMVNLSYTNLMYEANTAVFKISKQMFQDSLELLK